MREKVDELILGFTGRVQQRQDGGRGFWSELSRVAEAAGLCSPLFPPYLCPVASAPLSRGTHHLAGPAGLFCAVQEAGFWLAAMPAGGPPVFAGKWQLSWRTRGALRSLPS